jgi:hypothetical protein
MKLFTQAEKKAEKILKDIETHPLTVKIREDQAAATLSKRTDAAAKIDALKKDRDEIIPKLQAELAEKEKIYQQAKTALDTATVEFNKAKMELSSKSYSFSHAISQQEGVLHESVDQKIDEAIEFFQKKLTWLRSPGRISHNMLGGERNVFTEQIKTKVESNRDAVLNALGYCQQAIKRLETSKLSPELDIEMIEKLKAEIPDINIFEETTGERALPGSKGVNPRHLLPSDDLMEWKKNKLLEKAKKILSR